MIRQVEIRVTGQRVGFKAMSKETIKYYMSKGFELRVNGSNIILSRAF